MKLKNIRISSPNLYKLDHSGSYQFCGLNPKVSPMPSSLLAPRSPPPPLLLQAGEVLFRFYSMRGYLVESAVHGLFSSA